MTIQELIKILELYKMEKGPELQVRVESKHGGGFATDVDWATDRENGNCIVIHDYPMGSKPS